MAASDWDRRALPVCVGAVLATALVAEVLVVLLRFPPPGQPFPFWPIASLLFLLTSALESSRRFIMASPSTRGVMLAGAGQGWDYCYACQTHVPPRCNHCFTCNVCVLRRDHHCLLLGQCLGYQNYRYFLCLLLYGSVALLYGSLLNANVVWMLLEEGGLAHTILLLTLPWLMLLMGQVSFVTFVYAFVTDICVVGFLFCISFLLFHSLLALRGQTTKEWFEGNRQYHLGWRNNLRQIMGNHWLLAFLTPFITSHLPGDGINFQTSFPKTEVLSRSHSS
ncbi:probable palmitoyltransferase ZDHHC24 [Thamnophis elegans]|uniref:probable palmitoyltransferase ZDHHC24 n=1 Tax=Thamnophis elegans TaxID=35005 RepID=UPI0013776A03|nr:probable palmitoyltransferase ZDHHC24 [Thamnophis elegans]